MNDDIDSKLKSWKVGVEAPGRFNAGVWDRIAAGEAAREQSFSHRIAAVCALFVRPRYAMAFAAIALFAGVAAANVESRSANAMIWKNLETRYITFIDTRLHAFAMQ